MNDTALYISNGTCFFGPGQVADSNYIPCGNAALMGPQSCCYAGDYCLSSTACWNKEYVVTYVAGCTDTTFSSAECTNKFDYPNQQYVAMARCEGADIDIWSGCYNHTSWIKIQKEPDCKCNASRPLIRNSNGKSTLDEVGILPTAAGGTISYNPTAIPTLGSTTSSSYSSPQISPTSTTSPAPVADTSHGLSSGAKVGVGVGVGIGVPLIAALIFLAFILRRRKGGETTAAAASAPPPPPDNTSPQDGQADAAAVAMREKASSPDKEIATTPEPPSPGWYGYKPELAANSTFKSELSGDEPRSAISSSWNSETLGGHQISELSSHDAVTSAVGRNSME
ncbi:uncharacterized protein GGS22DRAFT_153904 [Annulohypoxylon maeteangense]|uniref:uncharacterized protein n=1 Tax=Annulohypoxylon maeteangense TaxID=1927788 RepID=UPI0020071E9F|nr:uncharacterized protein GGS22DRAFT_153904 [Annulohypoxylon maeteangense]KAI0889446.1 hypothetical protein GGS22DRAFT_153904 [Annulohypoxylon maeteangense]